LVENVKDNIAFGRIPQDKLVLVETNIPVSAGDTILVKITDADIMHLKGVYKNN